MEALLLFKMAEGHHVFHSKSRIKRLGMSYVIGLFFYLCIRFRSTIPHLIVSDGIRRKRKLSDPCDSDSVELKIKILSLFFFIHTGMEGSLYFQFRHQHEPALNLHLPYMFLRALLAPGITGT